MSTQDTYVAGLNLVRQLAVLTANQANEDPSFSYGEWDVLRQRVVKFIGWCKDNDKAQDFKVWLNAQSNKSFGEYDIMMSDIAEIDNVTL